MTGPVTGTVQQLSQPTGGAWLYLRPHSREGKRSSSATIFSSTQGYLSFSLSESDMFCLEAKDFKNVIPLKPDTVGNLGKHISVSRWITLMQIFGESHFVFQYGWKGNAGCHELYVRNNHVTMCSPRTNC